jgi:hypothetical protein
MKTLFILGLGLAATSAHAARTLVDCDGYRIEYTGATPRWIAGDPLKNTESKRDQWAVEDGHYANGTALYFVDKAGKRYAVKAHREMAFQYNRYVIEMDVLDIPDFRPLGDLGEPGVVSILHEPHAVSASIMGLGDDEPQCKVIAAP